MTSCRRTSASTSAPRRIGLVTLIICFGAFASVAQAQQLSTTTKGAIGGGLLGAGTGAIVGAAVQHPVSGALIGGGIGAVGGGLIGNQLEQREVAQHRLQSQVNANQRQIDIQRQEIQELKQASSTTTNASNTEAFQETE